MRFDDSRFRFSHGKAPRGRGFWIFENEAREVVFEHNGFFSEAKDEARRFAAKQQAAGRPVGKMFVSP
jgi:hypothetical protein